MPETGATDTNPTWSYSRLTMSGWGGLSVTGAWTLREHYAEFNLRCVCVCLWSRSMWPVTPWASSTGSVWVMREQGSGSGSTRRRTSWTEGELSRSSLCRSITCSDCLTVVVDAICKEHLEGTPLNVAQLWWSEVKVTVDSCSSSSCLQRHCLVEANNKCGDSSFSFLYQLVFAIIADIDFTFWLLFKLKGRSDDSKNQSYTQISFLGARASDLREFVVFLHISNFVSGMKEIHKKWSTPTVRVLKVFSSVFPWQCNTTYYRNIVLIYSNCKIKPKNVKRSMMNVSTTFFINEFGSDGVMHVGVDLIWTTTVSAQCWYWNSEVGGSANWLNLDPKKAKNKWNCIKLFVINYILLSRCELSLLYTVFITADSPHVCLWCPGGGNPVSLTVGPVTVSAPETKTALTSTATDASTTCTAPPGCATSARDTASTAEQHHRLHPGSTSAQIQSTTTKHPANQTTLWSTSVLIKHVRSLSCVVY